MKDIDVKLFNALGLSSVISAKDNTIKSLQGKVEYLKEEIDKLNSGKDSSSE